jgi:coenzyme F420-reducing hydrogenase alpha subunit
MHDTIDLSLKNISKIEGHTHLDIKVRNGRVVESKLKVSENKRFFTQTIEGKKFPQVPLTMSRICGTCSSAHTLCSIEAIERAFDIIPSEQTINLRKLLGNGSHLRDHAMHLYFFSLPDIFNKDSVLDFSEKEHEWIHDGLHVKEAGNFLTTIIGGRAVHPPNAGVGNFSRLPRIENIKIAIQKLESSREKILRLIELFYKNKKDNFPRKTNYLALVNDDYNFLKGEIKTAKGTVIPEEKYAEHFERVILPYSTATAFKWESQEFFVGALARINLNKANLNPRTYKDVQSYLRIFPSNDIFKNRLAQAIEMLNEVDNSINILESAKFKIQKPKPIKPKAGRGVGVVEAPRGTLYYGLDFNDKGTVLKADLSIPTQQNILHMQNNIARYVESMLDLPKQEISLNVEKMIRAYDPCMSCATHFLKINWK